MPSNMAKSQAAISAKAKETYANRTMKRRSGGKGKGYGRPTGQSKPTDQSNPTYQSNPTGSVNRYRYSPEEWEALRSSQHGAWVQESAHVLAVQVATEEDGWATIGQHGKSRQVTKVEARDITHAKQTLETERCDTELANLNEQIKASQYQSKKSDVLPISAPNKHGWASVKYQPNFSKPQRGDNPVLVFGDRRVTVAQVRRERNNVRKPKSGFTLLDEETNSVTEFPSLGVKKAIKSNAPPKTVRFTVPVPKLDVIDQALADITKDTRDRITKKVAAAKAKQAFASKPKTEKPKSTNGVWGKKSVWVKSSMGKTVPKPIVVVPHKDTEDPEVFVFSDTHIKSNDDDLSGVEFWAGCDGAPASPEYPPEIQGDWGAMDEWDRAHA